jgi:murein DD-endopeptidase MepM/ murein hydrolase activator NlpD
MVLLATVQGATVTQEFGQSHLTVEPSMWFVSEKAYWLPFLGASFSENFHPGRDRAAPVGTPVRAMEQGVVRFAGWKDNVSGFQVEVEIRENTRYSVNHLSVVKCRVGQKVDKGQTIALVGSTGASTGPHTHEGVSIREQDNRGVFRTFLYNPELFTKGGRLENSPLIKPEQRYIQLNGAGINIRRNDGDLFDPGSVYAVSRSDGIYRVGTGRRLGPLGKRFPFLRWRETEGGTWAVCTGFSRQLAIHRGLIHFT